MPALSFQEMWLRKLLDGTKQQTTRRQTDRIKVGDICHLYNQQRRRIPDKQMLSPTRVGAAMIFQMIEDEGRYPQPECDKSFGYSIDPYYAHFLGKVEITEVYDIHPCEMTEEELEAWAVADGFKGFHPTGVFPEQLCALEPGANMWFQRRYGDDWMHKSANMWFQRRYGDDWMHKIWTVIRWDGWLERYFLAECEAIR
jgi:hypothetical protein